MDRSIAQEDSFRRIRLNDRDGAHTPAARKLGSAIFYALLTLIALAAIPYGTVEPWWQALFECVVFVLAALSLIELFLSGSWNVSSHRILLPLVALALFGLLQTVSFGGGTSLKAGVRVSQALSVDPHGTRLWVAEMFAFVLVAAMLLRYTFTPRRLRLVIYFVISIAVASAVFGLARKATQHEPGFILPYLMPGFGYAQFINSNHFAFLMEMSFGLVLGLSVAGGVRRDRLPLFLGIALLLGMSLVLSNSRGGILSLLCQLIVVALFFSVRSAGETTARSGRVDESVRQITKSPVVRALLVLCLIIAVSIGIVLVGGDPLIWRATWPLIKEHPVAGVGMGGYWVAISKYHDGSGEMTPQRAHNDYLELLASGGLIAGALGAWFAFLLIRNIRIRLRSADTLRRASAFGALVGFSGVAVHSFVDFGLHITFNAVVFIILMVIASADVRRDKKLPNPAAR